MLTLPENISCGYCDCSEFGSLTISPKRTVNKYEIEFYIEDGLTTITDTKIYKIKKNYIQIAKPGQVRYSKLPFRTAYLKFNASGTIAEQLANAPDYFCCSHPAQLRNKLDEIILLLEKGDDSELLLQSCMLSVINLIIYDSKISTANIGIDYQTISAAKKFIENHYSEKIKLNDIAKSVNLSDIYFHKCFTLATGLTPHQYLMRCRIENAKKLLWNSDMAMSGVAEKCGFCSQQHMNKIFKKETGMTPLQYRKNIQQNYLY